MLISIKTLLVPVIYLDFELRKDFIIKNLCENRFKPQLKCNGTCYLAKKLNKIAEDNATKETQKKSQSMKKIMEEVFETTPLFSCELMVKNLSKKNLLIPINYLIIRILSFQFSILPSFDFYF